jgi:hypothetical protein
LPTFFALNNIEIFNFIKGGKFSWGFAPNPEKDY